MNQKLALFPVIVCLLLGCSGVLSGQDVDNNKHQIAVRFIAPNYLLPVENLPDEFNDSEYFGAGLQFEYQRRLTPNLLLGVPIHVSYAEAVDEDFLTNGLAFNANNGLEPLVSVGGDLLIVLEPIARRSVFDPQIFGGIGYFSESFDNSIINVPVGVNLNIRLSDNFYLSPSLSYRIALNDFDEAIRKNIQPGIGLHIQLGDATPKPPPPPVVIDTDGDGIQDADDRCPNVVGIIALQGCPDADGDGIADGDDKCPEVAGTTAFMGCPDTDGDGLADPDDKCPEQAGPRDNEGCPLADRDGDGVPDAEDKCPDVAGTVAQEGCPDTDGDGVPDAQDRCPDQAGTLANSGCPDSDGDSVIDPDDRCPDEAGPIDNRGCPEIDEEDEIVLQDATRSIGFETAKAVLTADSRIILNNVADILKRYPAYSVAIGGHTDSVGSAESNQSLSERRAKAVLDYLVLQGISTSRMSSRGYGETQPIADNRYAAGREENRRVTLDLSVN